MQTYLRPELLRMDDMEQEEKSLFFPKLVAKISLLWPWLILSVIVCLLAAYCYFHFSSPRYNIRASVLVQDDKKGTAFAESAVLQDLGMLTGKSSVDNEAEIFKSRALMEKVVEELQLNVRYFVPHKIRKGEIFLNRPVNFRFITNDTADIVPGEYTIEFDKANFTHFILSTDTETYKGHLGDTIKVKDGLLVISAASGFSKWPADQPLIVSVTHTDNIVLRYMLSLNVEIPNKQVSVIYLTLSEPVPQKGEAILKSLIKAYLQENVNDKNRIADSTIRFIDDRIQLVSGELTTIEKNIEGFRTTNKMTDMSQQSHILLENSSTFIRQQTNYEVQLSVVQSLKQFLADNKNNLRVVPSSLIMQEPSFLAIIGRYNEMQLQRDKMLMSLTEDHPSVQTMDVQLRNLKAELLSSISSIQNGIEVSIEEIKKRNVGFDREILKVPSKERIFLDYSRQQAIKQELYLFLLKKREETAISKSSTVANARIIDKPKSDGSPFKPKKGMIILGGLLAGLIMPFAFSFGKDALNQKVASIKDITEQTRLPVLAEIGHNDGSQSVVVDNNSRGIVAEQFRSLRTNIQYLLPGENDKIILVTSSMGGEGKSFLSINLANVLALAGKKVILLELDLRKPKITNYLNLKKSGFTDYCISNGKDWQKWVQPVDNFENFHVLSSGPIPPNPTELLMLPKTGELFADLKNYYDFIIIDSPPAGIVTDAEIIAFNADATLFLVRLNLTLKQQVSQIEQPKLLKNLPKLNIIVNDVKISKSTYGYGYGYIDVKAKK